MIKERKKTELRCFDWPKPVIISFIRPITNLQNPTCNNFQCGTVVSSNNHSDIHMLLIPIEKKLKNERDSFRKAREAHIVHKAKTLEPPGTNKRDEL